MSGTRSALLVAASDYEDPELTRLRWPSADVSSLAEVLADGAIGGFEVREPLVNQPTHLVKRKIDEFLSEATKADFRLLYFSCHGVLSGDRRLYFAMPDTQTKWIMSTGVDDVFVHMALQRSAAGTKVLILDCCHSGAFGRGLASKGPQERDIDVGRFEGGGVVTLTASKEIEYAYEAGHLTELTGATGGSVFTRVLVEGLRSGEADLDNNGVISVDELYEWIAARMRAETDRQRPGRSSYLHGSVAIGWTRRSRLPDGVRARLEDSASLHGRLWAIETLRELSKGADDELAAEVRGALLAAATDEDARVAASAEAALHGRPAPVAEPTPGEARAAPSIKAASLIRSGDQQRVARRFKPALDRYDEALRLSLDATDARVGRAQALQGLHRHGEALEALDAAVTSDPASVWARVSRAELLVGLDRPAGALLDVEAALASEPDSIEALTTHGRALAALGRLPEALAAFERALADGPDHVEAHVGHAEALAASGNPRKALAAVDRAIELDGASVDARLAKARLHYGANQLARGDAEVGVVLERDSTNVPALLVRGLAHLRRKGKHVRDPLPDFDRVLAAVRDLPAALFGRAVLLHERDSAEALRAVERIEGAERAPGMWHPPAADVRALEAGILLSLGRAQDALAAADAALAEAPGSPGALVVRAQANLALDRPELALLDLDEAGDGAGDVEAAQALRNIALGSLMTRPRAVWPEGISEDDIARALHGDAFLSVRLPDVPFEPMELARKLGPGERPVWLTACRYRQEMLRRIVLLLTSEQLVWIGRTEGQVPWRDVRDVHPLPPKGMRLVLRSGRRLEFPGISDAGVALGDELSRLDAAGVRELAGSLTREAAAGPS